MSPAEPTARNWSATPTDRARPRPARQHDVAHRVEVIARSDQSSGRTDRQQKVSKASNGERPAATLAITDPGHKTNRHRTTPIDNNNRVRTNGQDQLHAARSHRLS